MKIDDFVGVMDSFVGTVESPLGSNRTPIGEEFGWNGVAWCAETVSVASHRLGFPLHEAAVARIAANAKLGNWGLRWTRTPTRGAIVCFDFGGRERWGDMHTGVVRDVLADQWFRAIEGNHRDRCEVVLRNMKFVMGFAVPPFENSEIVKPTPVPVVFGGTIMNGVNRAQGGYALFGPDGGVFNYEGSPFFGSLPSKGIKPNAPIVSMAWTLSGNGYWLLGEDGGVFPFGDAPFKGSYPGLPAEIRNDPNRKFAAICARTDGGYATYSAKREPYEF